MSIYNNYPEPYRVLIVDDDKLTLAVEQAIFEKYYDIVVANNGCEAWEALKVKKFDAVLTDVQMPHMDGVTLTKKIRTSLKHNKDIVIIGLTASTDNLLRQACIHAGMNAVVTKPATQQEIMDRLKAKMGGKKRISERRSLKKLALSKVLA